MTDLSTLAGQCGGVEVNRFSQSDYLQSYSAKAAEDFAEADENTGKESAIKNVNAVCPSELKYASDRWIMHGEFNGVGADPFSTPGYWLISAGVHMTAMVVADDGSAHYFDSNEGDARFPGGAAQFIKCWFTEKKWGQTRFIQFVDI